MLSLLPQILFLSPLAITLLRVVLALYIAYIAWYVLDRGGDIARTRLPIIGFPPAWIIWLSALLAAAIAALIFVGAWVQVAAICAFILSVKHLIAVKSYASILPFPRSTYILMAIISLSLVFMGAGAFAFDLPL